MPVKQPKMSRFSNEGRETTSGVLIGPASKLVMDNESERVVEASVDRILRRNSEVGGSTITVGGELVFSCHMETGGQMSSKRVKL